jgi:uncharacterized protein (UPF0332 family)
MDPRDFLDVAFDLAGEAREADWRSAVSRAYYAAFHVASELLARCGFPVPRGDQAHGYGWIRLANCGDAQTVQAAKDLDWLRRNRNRADYDLGRPVSQQHASDLVRLADSIIQVFDQVLASPTLLAQITPVMRDYERDVLGDVSWQGPTP